MKAKLALENGIVLTGEAFGASGEIAGEVVFNTSLSGYQEIFTDPSYCGQIVTLTYPLAGNYGINDLDLESAHPQVAGVIVREYIDTYSNFRAQTSLGEWLRRHGIVAIQGVDTRMLTRMIREQGALRGVLATGDVSDAALLAKAQASPSMSGRDLASVVTCKEPYEWEETDALPFHLPVQGGTPPSDSPLHVVAYDFGIKRNILRRLSSYGCSVRVVPADTPASDVLALDPDGIFLSNGPGDPAAVKVAIRNVRELLGKKPIFGICLGHQILSLALGGRTFKLKFGHRGGNHPVKNLITGRIEITSQNHGFAVDPSTLDPGLVEVTHVNLYDGTNEGVRHRTLPVFSVQYHPEASPGPHDSDYLFRDFVGLMRAAAPADGTLQAKPGGC
jgi:carbamoyl-phosphate synthase small subunit